jgi:4a-hydroxytetrahydrobiopterin dehydratase
VAYWPGLENLGLARVRGFESLRFRLYIYRSYTTAMKQDTSLPPDELTQGKCVPCEGGTDPLSIEDENKYESSVENWQLDRSAVHLLRREVTLKNFSEVLDLVNKIGELAEAEGHHPNLYLHDYKYLRIELSTFAIKGLSMNDFIMAAKIDELVDKK